MLFAIHVLLRMVLVLDVKVAGKLDKQFVSGRVRIHTLIASREGALILKESFAKRHLVFSPLARGFVKVNGGLVHGWFVVRVLF